MLVLSSYRLSRENNRRIASAVEGAGGTFIPTRMEDDLQEIVERIDGHIAEAAVFLGGRLTEEQWERGGKLQWIHVPWAGVNSLLTVPGVRRTAIPVTNSSGVMADSVADQVMAYLLMLNRSLAGQIRNQSKREWRRYTSVEDPDRRILRGMTLGILGYGAIGRGVAVRGAAFGMRIIAVRRTVSPDPEPPVERFYAPDDLPRFLAACDFTVIALPLTPETEGLIGADEFRQMKRTACLVNIARGKIINEGELIAALKGGTIAGAALDVFAEEPLPEDSVLWEMENVIVTPHSAGGFVGFGSAVTDLFLENLIRFTEGKELRNRVDPATGY